MKSLILAALLIGGAPGPEAGAKSSPTQDAIEQGIGVLCIPVLISGKLASEDLIRRSGFVLGTDPHSEKLPPTAFQHRLSNGDVVEVFVSESDQECTVHVHGDRSAIAAYHAVLKSQNWGEVGKPSLTDKNIMLELWVVKFEPPVGGAMQFVGIPQDEDPTKLRVTGFLAHTPLHKR